MKKEYFLFCFLFGIIFVNKMTAQVIFKEGYLVHINGERETGLIQLAKKGAFQQAVYFKKKVEDRPQKYTPSQLKAFGITDVLQYQSLSDLPLNASNEFARLVAKDQDLAYFQTIEKLSKFYIKNSEGEITKVPDGFEKVNLEQYKRSSAGYYDLPNNDAIDIPTKNGGFTWKGKRKFLFDGELFELKRTYIDYFEKLGKVKLDKSYDPLSPKLIRKYSKKIAKEKGQTWEAVDVKPRWQTSILAFFTPLTSIRNEQYVFEYGLMAELRDNRISPNWSLSLGASFYEEYSFFTFVIGCTNFPGFGKIIDRSSIPTFAIGNASALHFGTAYHFRDGKNIRPYLFARLNRQQIKSALDESVTTESAGFLVGSIYQARTEVSYRENVGAGVDYYFGKIHQVRLEGIYNRGAEIRIAYGIYFD